MTKPPLHICLSVTIVLLLLGCVGIRQSIRTFGDHAQTSKERDIVAFWRLQPFMVHEENILILSGKVWIANIGKHAICVRDVPTVFSELKIDDKPALEMMHLGIWGARTPIFGSIVPLHYKCLAPMNNDAYETIKASAPFDIWNGTNLPFLDCMIGFPIELPIPEAATNTILSTHGGVVTFSCQFAVMDMGHFGLRTIPLRLALDELRALKVVEAHSNSPR